MAKLFRITDQPREKAAEPVYTIVDGKLYRTVFHPAGWSRHWDYELRDDGRVYRSKHHPQGASNSPEFEFRGDGRLYRIVSGKGFPEYELSD